MAFIEVVTRCFKRPKMLRNNTDSLLRQTSDDWEQRLLIDEVGHGTTWANAQLADFEPEGAFVWVLDDDDMAVRDTLFEEVIRIVKDSGADMVMVKMDHERRGILPAPWLQEPQLGLIGSSAAFVRRDLWQKCAEAWRLPFYTADGEFMRRAFNQAEKVYWHDVIASKVQRISLGAPEDSEEQAVNS